MSLVCTELHRPPGQDDVQVRFGVEPRQCDEHDEVVWIRGIHKSDNMLVDATCIEHVRYPLARGQEERVSSHARGKGRVRARPCVLHRFGRVLDLAEGELLRLRIEAGQPVNPLHSILGARGLGAVVRDLHGPVAVAPDQLHHDGQRLKTLDPHVVGELGAPPERHVDLVPERLPEAQHQLVIQAIREHQGLGPGIDPLIAVPADGEPAEVERIARVVAHPGPVPGEPGEVQVEVQAAVGVAQRDREVATVELLPLAKQLVVAPHEAVLFVLGEVHALQTHVHLVGHGTDQGESELETKHHVRGSTQDLRSALLDRAQHLVLPRVAPPTAGAKVREGQARVTQEKVDFPVEAALARGQHVLLIESQSLHALQEVEPVDDAHRDRLPEHDLAPQPLGFHDQATVFVHVHMGHGEPQLTEPCEERFREQVSVVFAQSVDVLLIEDDLLAHVSELSLELVQADVLGKLDVGPVLEPEHHFCIVVLGPDEVEHRELVEVHVCQRSDDPRHLAGTCLSRRGDCHFFSSRFRVSSHRRLSILITIHSTLSS